MGRQMGRVGGSRWKRVSERERASEGGYGRLSERREATDHQLQRREVRIDLRARVRGKQHQHRAEV